MKGRKKSTDVMKVIKGTDQKVRMSGDATLQNLQITKVPPTPKLLDTTGKKVYRDTCREMISLRMLNTLNVTLVYMYAELLSLYIAESKVMTKLALFDRVLKICTELGFTPASQSRILGNIKNKSQEETEYENL